MATVSSAQYLAMALGVVRGLLVARILGPTGWGIFGGTRLVMGYLGHAHLGLLHGMNRLMPVRLGAGDRERAEGLQNTAFTACIALSGLAALGLFVFAAFFARFYEFETRLGLALGAAIIIAAQANVLYTSILRTFNRFGLIGKQIVLTAAVEFVLLIVLSRFFGFIGALAGVLVAGLSVFAYLVACSRIRLELRLRGDEVRSLLRAGFPLLLLVFANQLLRTVDQVLVLHYRHATDLGVYRVGALMGAALYNLPAAVGYVLFPRILRTYGRLGTGQALRRQLMLPTLALAGLVPVMAGAGALLIPLVVTKVLGPQYLVGVPTMRALLLAATFLALPVAGGNFLIAVEKEKHLIAVSALGAGLVAAATRLALEAGDGTQALLLRVSLGVCAGYAVTGALILADALRHYEPSAWPLTRQLLGLYLPIAYCLGAAWVSHRMIGTALGAYLGIWTNVPEAVGFLILCFPVLWYTNRRTDVLGAIVAILRRRG
ncbi:MAG: oligosaccharide flippase family protein [Armatimonadota bacterium]